MPFGDNKLGKYRPQKWLVASRDQSITRTNVELQSKWFPGIKLRLKFAHFTSQSHLPDNNELTVYMFRYRIGYNNRLHATRKRGCLDRSSSIRMYHMYSNWSDLFSLETKTCRLIRNLGYLTNTYQRLWRTMIVAQIWKLSDTVA